MIRIHVKKVCGDNRLITAVSKFESAATAIIDGNEYIVKSIMSSVVINNAKEHDLIIDGLDEKQLADEVKKLFCLENS